ncbi:MAG: hypothetical protein IKW39_03170 [Alphaproteobacteria bacterium]|nr:hypothetical protein [Alphaproteobacteria bacterium]
MLKQLITTLILSTILTACATSYKYTQKLNQDVGKTFSDITQEYGNPSSIKRYANGDMIISYVYLNTSLLPDPDYGYDATSYMTEDEEFAPFTFGGDEIPIGSYMGEIVTNYCNTKFYLKNNIVTSWSYKGNSCVSL